MKLANIETIANLKLNISMQKKCRITYINTIYINTLDAPESVF